MAREGRCLGCGDDSIVIDAAECSRRFKPYVGVCGPVLTLPRRSARSCKELNWVDLQHLSKLPDDFQADIGHGALDSADVGTIHARLICQILLGNTPVVPDTAQIGRESMAEVHTSANRSAAY